jgi:peptidoglycan/LPS O-acetylase OafA/YrhL
LKIIQQFDNFQFSIFNFQFKKVIQRIQSIFLLIASACSFALFGFPFATVKEKVADSALFATDTVYNLNDSTALLGIYVVAGLLALVAIFLFKNRNQQKTVARVAAVVNLVGIVLAVVLFMKDGVMESAVSPNDGLGLYTPILGFVLNLLAIRAIGKDEKLVKSMDRLR